MSPNHKLPKFSQITLCPLPSALICDRIIKWGLIFLIVFTPLAFGAVHTWSCAIMELTVIFLLLIWLLKITVASKNPHLQPARTPQKLPILLFILLVLFQLLPLPPKAIRHLSPNTYNLYKTTLPDYDSASHLATNNGQPTTDH